MLKRKWPYEFRELVTGHKLSVSCKCEQYICGNAMDRIRKRDTLAMVAIDVDGAGDRKTEIFHKQDPLGLTNLHAGLW